MVFKHKTIFLSNLYINDIFPIIIHVYNSKIEIMHFKLYGLTYTISLEKFLSKQIILKETSFFFLNPVLFL